VRGLGLALVLAGLAGLLVSCVPTTVHPLYRPGDLVQDPGLMGVWTNADGTARWTFAGGLGKSYTLEIQADAQQVNCVAHLLKLGEARFLDLYPADPALQARLGDNPYSVGLIPVHVFLRVEEIGARLRMSCLGMDWLRERLKRDPSAVAHVLLADGRVVLTGETEALQAFVREHLDDAAASNGVYEGGLMKGPAKPAEK
jgi:hypothetical protein